MRLSAVIPDAVLQRPQKLRGAVEGDLDADAEEEEGGDGSPRAPGPGRGGRRGDPTHRIFRFRFQFPPMWARCRQLFSHPLAGPVPWLMLATAFRIIHITDPKAVISFQIAQLSIFVAFLVAAQRLIEIAGGKTSLRSWRFGTQVSSGFRILGRIAVLVTAAGFGAALLGDYSFAWEIFYGIDGIAFDGTGVRPKAISGVLAALILLMVLQVDRGEASSLVGAGREFISRIRYLGAAIIAITMFLIAFSALQGVVRRPMFAFWSGDQFSFFRTLIYFGFVLGFAAIRLWVVLAILTFSLRQSYRAQNAVADVGASPPDPDRLL